MWKIHMISIHDDEINIKVAWISILFHWYLGRGARNQEEKRRKTVYFLGRVFGINHIIDYIGIKLCVCVYLISTHFSHLEISFRVPSCPSEFQNILICKSMLRALFSPSSFAFLFFQSSLNDTITKNSDEQKKMLWIITFKSSEIQYMNRNIKLNPTLIWISWSVTINRKQRVQLIHFWIIIFSVHFSLSPSLFFTVHHLLWLSFDTAHLPMLRWAENKNLHWKCENWLFSRNIVDSVWVPNK